MRVQVFNANGLAGKAEEIQRFAGEQGSDIVVTLETWLSQRDAVPIPSAIANITSTRDGVISGGKRNHGGILVNVLTPEYLTCSRLIRIALDGHAAVMEINGVIFIFAYLPPSLPDTCINDLLTLAEETVQGRDSRCVIAGDLNARCAELTGDHHTSTRGRVFANALSTSAFTLQRSVSGLWTSFNESGYGIPDVVLANFKIHNVTVHEKVSCADSDHRPITFTIEDSKPRDK